VYPWTLAASSCWPGRVLLPGPHSCYDSLLIVHLQAVRSGGGEGGGGGVGGGVDHGALRRAVHARTAFFIQHADDACSTLNIKEARQILEGDLGLTLVHLEP